MKNTNDVIKKKKLGKRNFGEGSKAGFAGANVLRKHLGKKPSSRHAHKHRWNIFAKFLRSIGISDTRRVTIETIELFAQHLKKRIESEEIKISYAVNILSSVNITLSLMREDNALKVSPKALLGRRTRIRTIAPKGMNQESVFKCIQKLEARGAQAQAMAIVLMREFGLRKREACLFNACKALEEANKGSEISITRGTKGGYGRKMERKLKVNSRQRELLVKAAAVQGSSDSLTPEGRFLKQFMGSTEYHWQLFREGFGLGKLHDLRACFACDRYFELTGHLAPVLSGRVTASWRLDLEARKTISKELGHKRIDIIAAYIGGGSKDEPKIR